MTSLQKASLEEVRAAAARICRDYLTGRWKTVTTEQITVKRISGGLSNFLYYVSLPPDGAATDGNRNERDCLDLAAAEGTSASKRQRTNSSGMSSLCNAAAHQAEPQEVLLRIYGQTHGGAGDALEGMITESVVFALLSERNFGPKLYGIFPGGRIEQFLPARALVTSELPIKQISLKIAQKMGEIHSLDIPMSKEPDWLWNCMERWLTNITSLLSRTDWKDADMPYVAVVRAFNFQAERKWLRKVIDQGNYPVVFCHNDLQEGNILLCKDDSLSDLQTNFEKSAISDNLKNSALEVGIGGDGETSQRKRSNSPNTNNNNNNKEDAASGDCSLQQADNGPDLKIIDFEYCAYNYRGFDLANHFLEWTFNYNNPRHPFYFHYKLQYPTAQQRQDFIVTYLKKLHEHVENYEPSADELAAVEEEVRVFSMFSHLFWILWSVVNVSSNIEFGYWEYAATRIHEFLTLKEQYERTRDVHNI